MHAIEAHHGDPHDGGGTWWVDFSVIGCLTVFLKDGKQTRMVLLRGYDKLLSAHNTRLLLIRFQGHSGRRAHLP